MSFCKVGQILNILPILNSNLIIIIFKGVTLIDATIFKFLKIFFVYFCLPCHNILDIILKSKKIVICLNVDSQEYYKTIFHLAFINSIIKK